MNQATLTAYGVQAIRQHYSEGSLRGAMERSIHQAFATASRERIQQQANEIARRNVISGNIAESERQDFRERVQSIINERR